MKPLGPPYSQQSAPPHKPSSQSSHCPHHLDILPLLKLYIKESHSVCTVCFQLLLLRVMRKVHLCCVELQLVHSHCSVVALTGWTLVDRLRRCCLGLIITSSAAVNIPIHPSVTAFLGTALLGQRLSTRSALGDTA